MFYKNISKSYIEYYQYEGKIILKETDITEQLISYFNKEKKCFKLNKVNKIKANYKQYKYDIEVIKNDKTVAIVEAKKRFKSNMPTTDAIIGSLVKAYYEYLFHFQSEVKIILLFYVNHESLIIKNKNEFKNNVLINLSKILSTQIEFHIINININEKEETQIKCFEEQLKFII